MRRSMVIAFTTATVAGIMLAPTAALAAGHSNGVRHFGPAESAGKAQAGSDPSTDVTFTVNFGDLTISVPDSADLTSGTGLPGTDISGNLGDVTVTDDRALLTAAWIATASASDFTTGAKSLAETIPATDIGYNPGTFTTTGTNTPTGFPITMSNAAQTVVTGTAGVGDNSATWNPLITVHVPAQAVAGLYAGTISHSVS